MDLNDHTSRPEIPILDVDHQLSLAGVHSQDPSLDEYKAALLDLFDSKSTHFFPNESEAHAAIVYELFFRVSRNAVKILCEKLRASVFGKQSVVAALKDALVRGVHVSVISEIAPESSEFLDVLRYYRDAGLVDINSFNKEDIVDFNFCVVDGEAFRWEHNNKTPSAVGNMHRPDIAKKLAKYFDEIPSKLTGHGLVSV
jgi:hypothetical protein